MKTPRFFIVLAACAVVFTIASSSLESAFRPCRAETLPVLRVDPWAGDPEDPKGPMEIPYDDWGAYSTIDDLESTQTTAATLEPRRSFRISWRSAWGKSLIRMFFGWRL